MATIRDIAKAADVSPATVSRVLNHDKTITVTDETRNKIFKIAEKLSYKKTKRNKKSPVNLINFGLVYGFNEVEEVNDPYFLSIRLGIEEECRNLGISLSLISPTGLLTKNSPIGQFQGLLLLGRFNKEQINKFKAYSSNIVLVHSSLEDYKYNQVCVDFNLITKNVLDYFTSKGHTKIGFVGGREKIIGTNMFFEDYRTTSYIDYMKKKNLFYEKYMEVGIFDIVGGYESMYNIYNKCKEDLPTCIFAASDSIAIGVLRAIQEISDKNLINIKIIGCNDIPTAKFFTPSISTVKIYTNFMGRQSVKVLIDQLNNPKSEKIKIFIPHKLVIRES